MSKRRPLRLAPHTFKTLVFSSKIDELYIWQHESVPDILFSPNGVSLRIISALPEFRMSVVLFGLSWKRSNFDNLASRYWYRARMDHSISYGILYARKNISPAASRELLSTNLFSIVKKHRNGTLLGSTNELDGHIYIVRWYSSHTLNAHGSRKAFFILC